MGRLIYWHNVKKLVEYLADAEYQILVKEYNLRKLGKDDFILVKQWMIKWQEIR